VGSNSPSIKPTFSSGYLSYYWVMKYRCLLLSTRALGLILTLSLISGILGSGCLSSSADENVIEVKILQKNISPAELGECTYTTTLAITNNGTRDIAELAILVEIYDPDAQRVAAQQSLPLRDLRAAETRQVTAVMQTHCRMNYTLRAYARY
jgi:hypothetical protein